MDNIGTLAGAGGGAVLLAAIAGFFTLLGRWLALRSSERGNLRSDEERRRHEMADRISKLEARSDMLQAQLAIEQRERSEERVKAAGLHATMSAQIARLESDLALERKENVRNVRCPLAKDNVCVLVRGLAAVPSEAV